MVKEKALQEMLENVPVGSIGFLILMGYENGSVEDWDWCSEKGWIEEYSNCGGGKWWNVFHRIEMLVLLPNEFEKISSALKTIGYEGRFYENVSCSKFGEAPEGYQLWKFELIDDEQSK